MSETRGNLIDICKSYYEKVDKEQYDAVVSMFSANVIYQRCEEEISGIDRLKKFYKEDRKIR